MLSCLLLSIVLVALPQQAQEPVGSGPTPAASPAAWELEFRFLDPQRIEHRAQGAERPEVYWYMVYTVVNRSPRSVRFFPWFQIVTEDLKIYDTDTGIPPDVFDLIRERHRVTHRYLVTPTRAIGAVLSGEDNARESVAIWRDIDFTSNSFTVYVAGLSGEVQAIRSPTTAQPRPAPGSASPDRPAQETVSPPAEPAESEPREAAPARASEKTGSPGAARKLFTLRKTLAIRYNLPGSPSARPAVAAERVDVRWIMR